MNLGYRGGPWRALALAVVLGTTSTGCQRGKTQAEMQQVALARDLERICNALQRSGADRGEPGTEPLVVAQWLAANVESQAGRDFLARFSRTAARDKAGLLAAEAQRHGLHECPLVTLWAGP
jgi:hypothetical protein